MKKLLLLALSSICFAGNVYIENDSFLHDGYTIYYTNEINEYFIQNELERVYKVEEADDIYHVEHELIQKGSFQRVYVRLIKNDEELIASSKKTCFWTRYCIAHDVAKAYKKMFSKIIE